MEYQHVITVQPIQVKSEDGTIVGNPEKKLFKKLTQNIYNQAQIKVEYLPWKELVGNKYISWDSTDESTLGLRPLWEDGFPQKTEGALNLYFVESIGRSFGLAWKGSGAVAISNKVFTFVPMGDSYYYRGDTLAHEIGHLLGLLHVGYTRRDDGKLDYYSSILQEDGSLKKMDLGVSFDRYVRVLMAGGRVIGESDGSLVYPLAKLYSDKLMPEEIEVIKRSPCLKPYVEKEEEIVAEDYDDEAEKTDEPDDSLKKAEEAEAKRKAEEALKKAEEARLAEEEARRLEEEAKLKEATDAKEKAEAEAERLAEEAKKAEEARKLAEEKANEEIQKARKEAEAKVQEAEEDVKEAKEDAKEAEAKAQEAEEARKEAEVKTQEAEKARKEAEEARKEAEAKAQEAEEARKEAEEKLKKNYIIPDKLELHVYLHQISS